MLRTLNCGFVERVVHDYVVYAIIHSILPIAHIIAVAHRQSFTPIQSDAAKQVRGLSGTFYSELCCFDGILMFLFCRQAQTNHAGSPWSGRCRGPACVGGAG